MAGAVRGRAARMRAERVRVASTANDDDRVRAATVMAGAVRGKAARIRAAKARAEAEEEERARAATVMASAVRGRVARMRAAKERAEAEAAEERARAAAAAEKEKASAAAPTPRAAAELQKPRPGGLFSRRRRQKDPSPAQPPQPPQPQPAPQRTGRVVATSPPQPTGRGGAAVGLRDIVVRVGESKSGAPTRMSSGPEDATVADGSVGAGRVGQLAARWQEGQDRGAVSGARQNPPTASRCNPSHPTVARAPSPSPPPTAPTPPIPPSRSLTPTAPTTTPPSPTTPSSLSAMSSRESSEPRYSVAGEWMEQVFGARAPSRQEAAAVRAPPAISARTSASSGDGSRYSSGRSLRLSFRRDDAPRQAPRNPRYKL